MQVVKVESKVQGRYQELTIRVNDKEVHALFSGIENDWQNVANTLQNMINQIKEEHL